MKHLIVFFSAILLFVSTSGLAQNQNESDKKLLAKFSPTELNAMSTEDLGYWNFVAEHGFVVFEIRKEKSESEMEMIEYTGNIDALNPFELGLSPEETTVKTYQLGNTGFGLMVLSETKIRAKMARLK